jgi:hypothetical protein
MRFAARKQPGESPLKVPANQWVAGMFVVAILVETSLVEAEVDGVVEVSLLLQPLTMLTTRIPKAKNNSVRFMKSSSHRLRSNARLTTLIVA